jgi:glycosyltransferase involved in cell wall biosynthesis
MRKPKISVVATTYNHENYILECIESVLGQTFENIELIVVNDGSTDGTEDQIKRISDDRLVYIKQENQGPSSALNTGIAACRGHYVAIMSGDDICEPYRLARELQQYSFDSRKKIIFGDCSYIDDNGNRIDYKDSTIKIRPELINRTSVIKELFDKGNYLCASSAFSEKTVFDELGLFNPLLLQLQDYEYWVRAVINGIDIVQMPDKVIRYRIRSKQGNLSALTPESEIRTEFEYFKVFSEFLSISASDYRNAFGKIEGRKVAPTDLKLAMADKFIQHWHHSWRAFGLSAIYDILHKKKHEKIIQYPVFFKRETEVNFFNKYFFKPCIYIDSGSGFNEEEKHVFPIRDYEDNFTINCDLSDYADIKMIRFDPFEIAMGKVEISRIFYITDEGSEKELEVIATNGVQNGDGSIEFLNEDSQILVMPPLACKELTITGSWQKYGYDELVKKMRYKQEQVDLYKEQVDQYIEEKKDRERNIEFDYYGRRKKIKNKYVGYVLKKLFLNR